MASAFLPLMAKAMINFRHTCPSNLQQQQAKVLIFVSRIAPADQ